MDKHSDPQQRVSAPEREGAITRLQEAYIRGQLSEHELGERIDRALVSVVRADLGALVADLPEPPAAPVATARVPWWRRLVPRSESVYKSSVRKNGAWTVPAVMSTSVYKGLLVLDLRQAVLTSHDTLIRLDAYKSRVALVVPPEYQVELAAQAYKGRLENLSSGGRAGAPRVLVKGSAYKSLVVVTNQDLSGPLDESLLE